MTRSHHNRNCPLIAICRYTQESADDGTSSASQPISSGPIATSSGSAPSSTVGSDTAESKSVRSVPKSLIGGVVGGIVIVAIILAIAVTFFMKARRARGVQLCRKQSILSLPEHTQDVEPGAADMVPRPFSTAETTTSSSTFLTKSQLYSSRYINFPFSCSYSNSLPLVMTKSRRK